MDAVRSPSPEPARRRRPGRSPGACTAALLAAALVLAALVPGCDSPLGAYLRGVAILASLPPGAEDAVFVSNEGSDSNGGLSPLEPKATIAAGIEAADAAGKGEVWVSGGDYPVSATIMMRSGIDLLGGYSDTFSGRDPAANPTVIEDTRTTWVGWAFTLRFSGLTDSRLDGFTILGPRTAAALAANTVSIDSCGGVVVRACRIHGAETSGGAGSISVALQSEGVPTALDIVEDCRIYGGVAESNAGIGSNGGYLEIRRNAIRVAGPGCFGITIGSVGGDAIRDNLILSEGSTPTTAGILTAGNPTGAIVDNNTILAAGIGIRNRGSDAVLRNNIILGIGGAGNIGVHEESGGSVAVLQDNCILGFASALFRDFSSGTYFTAIADLNVVANTTQGAAGSAAGNLSVDPLLVSQNGPDGLIATLDDNDWRLQDGSPVKAAGRDLSGLFLVDKDGNPRTSPWSMGAYERD